MHFCDTEEPTTWCNCTGCGQQVYTSSGRNAIRAEWENTSWLAYEELIRKLAELFPRLRLVEWFLRAVVRPARRNFVPFWQCEIMRGKRGAYSLKKELRNWPHVHPLMRLEGWNARRGIQYADDEKYEETQ